MDYDIKTLEINSKYYTVLSLYLSKDKYKKICEMCFNFNNVDKYDYEYSSKYILKLIESLEKNKAIPFKEDKYKIYENFLYMRPPCDKYKVLKAITDNFFSCIDYLTKLLYIEKDLYINFKTSKKFQLGLNF